MILPQHFHTPPAGSPAGTMTLVGGRWRIQVLTARLVRVEWSPSGRFEDRATQIVANRAFDAPRDVHIHARPDGGATVRTPWLTLEYDGQEFSASGLFAQVKQDEQWGGTWRWGVKEELPWITYRNLRGTARTLDNVDGRCDLDDGLVDGRGITALVDDTAALTPEGWVEARESGSLDVYVFAHGRDFRGAIADFYRLAGPQPILPRHALGNWWSRYHRYTQAEYTQVLDTFQRRRVPLSVAVIDMDWHLVDLEPEYGSGWTGFTWNRELFPDPEGLAEDIHRRGLVLTLNLHPADGVRAFEEAYERLAARLGIDTASGQPVPFDVADPENMLAHFEEVLAPLEDRGVDFWWVDWQQGTHSGIRGLDPLWVLNHLHVLHNRARSGGRGLTLSRYAGPGSHRYPVGFSGDTIVTWASLAFQPEFTATASNIGYGWWSHDIGGHMLGVRDGELSTRWVQFGVFSPILRLHSSNDPFTSKEPWRFGLRERRVQENFLRLRHRLVPYLHSEQVWGARELQPLIQPMYWEDAASPAAWEVPNQYMFGRAMTVAPVTVPADPVTDLAQVPVWLPEGQWSDLFTGVSYRGGRRILMHRPLEQIPVLARAGTVLPLAGIPIDGGGAPAVGVELPQEIEVVVVAGASGSYELVEDDGLEAGMVARTLLSWDDDARCLTVHPPVGDVSILPERRSWAIRIHGGDPDGGWDSCPGVAGRCVEATWDRFGALRSSLGSTAAMEGLSVCVRSAGPAPRESTPAGRVWTLLDRAKIEVVAKNQVMEAVDTVPPLLALAAVHAAPVPEDLRSAIVEVLTATP